jgi:hypothetical protein
VFGCQESEGKSDVFFLINEELSFEHGKGKQGNKRECVIW